MRKRMTFVLILVILVLAAVLWLVQNKKSEGEFVVVRVNEQFYGKYQLKKDQTIQIDTESGYNILQIKNGYASITESDCKNQICVHTRKISKTGESIICLPHKLVITIESGL